MNMHPCERKDRPDKNQSKSESGQSIVLIALVFVILLGFLGLAVDVGFAFARSSQFSRAVDSAALAGVVDLTATIEDPVDPVNNPPLCSGLTCADLRAQQFLAANGWPTPTLSAFESSSSITSEQGVPQYTITATWPVNFFFARVLGLRNFPISHSASAAFAAQSDMFTPTEYDLGQIRKASQFIVGKEGCAEHGDPVSPRRATSALANPEHSRYDELYRYRIRVPRIYTITNKIRIELFDVDASNTQSGPANGTFSKAGGDSAAFSLDCSLVGTNNNDLGTSCVVPTGEDFISAFENPLWFVRVDENFDQSCNAVGNEGLTDTVTTFELYYFDEDSERVPLATYVDDNTDLGDTDLKWVTPCANPATCSVVADSGSFDVSFGSIPIQGLFRYIYLDVSATGHAKNVWDVRASPLPSYYTDRGLPPLASDVNQRNLQLANSPAAYDTGGIEVFALGRMPLDHFIAGEQTLPLVPLPISLGEGAIYASLFDFDSPNPWTDGATVVNFQIDTLPADLSTNPSLAFNIDGLVTSTNPDPSNWESTCTFNAGGLNCNSSWLRPQYAMGITSDAFAGGTLLAKYTPNRDEMTWSIQVTSGRPYLTE